MLRYLACLGLVGAALGSAACGDFSNLAADGGQVPPTDDTTIAFADEATLKLKPQETAAVTVVVTPPTSQPVSFLLVGAALDASLDNTAVFVDDEGRATVTLRAPKGATNFALRASVKDGPSADLSVSVSEQGFGVLDIQPDYSGKRPTDGWEARVVTGSCEALQAGFPEDPEGALVGSAEVVGNSLAEPLLVEDAPVGPNLAVFVRAGHYMWGCTDESNLAPGSLADPATHKKVVVKILNKPLDLSETDADVTLGVDDGSSDLDAVAALLDARQTQLLNAFFANYAQGTSALLLATMKSISGDATAFEAASSGGDWPTLLDQHFDNHQVDLQGSLSGFAQQGLESQPLEVRGHLEAVPNLQGQALFTLTNLGTASGETMGLEPQLLDFTADPDDTVRLGGSIAWVPSRFIGHAMETAALVEYPNASGIPEVLAELAHCDTLVLEGLAGCDQSCIANLCSNALATMWASALDASSAGTISVQASAANPDFDDYATLLSFEGGWVGQVQSGALTAPVAGAVAGLPTGESPD